MYSKRDAFAFYVIIIIVLAMIGHRISPSEHGAILGAGAGVLISGGLYNMYAAQLY